MMVKYELNLATFEAWSGAKDTLETLIENNACETFEYILEDLYPDGLDETTLNDILWFDSEWVYEVCGIEEEDEEDEEDEDE